METKIYEIEEKCTLKQKFGKCFITLRLALFCMDCFTIHIQDRCPNCLSNNSVRLIELFLSEPDPSDEKIREVIRKKFLENY
ncbi:MAG: hypothetical protein QMD43_04010 [Thermodesulfovibrio sp.]|jgi:hypothetical protein|uniref:hypothetical protein n=1 Tax=Thermodesulfovibrio sp. 1176 TaxID=3043424 RepID=UPI0024822A7E|nr:hypothetical protein [Thermodesulfovibrio sp. 1176]MDI1472311.1 hypothetical protein [Thermodesulfovibrio sp. 1176]MDI6714176.1 hypothetical protein [Thermodesulfovibrio sp.]